MCTLKWLLNGTELRRKAISELVKLPAKPNPTPDTDVAGELTRRAKGAFLINRPAVFWYLRISIKAFVPGRNLRFREGVAGSGNAKMTEQLQFKTFLHEEMETTSMVHITNNGMKVNLQESFWLLLLWTKQTFWCF